MVHRKVVHNQTRPDAWCSVNSFFNDGTTQESFSHRNLLKLSLTFSVILYWNMVVRLVFLSSLLSSLLSCSSCFLCALQQNRALSRLLYLLNILQFVISCLFGLYKETIYLVESCSNLLQFRRSPSYSQCVCVSKLTVRTFIPLKTLNKNTSLWKLGNIANTNSPSAFKKLSVKR